VAGKKVGTLNRSTNHLTQKTLASDKSRPTWYAGHALSVGNSESLISEAFLAESH